jgi:hypothetical protein
LAAAGSPSSNFIAAAIRAAVQSATAKPCRPVGDHASDDEGAGAVPALCRQPATTIMTKRRQNSLLRPAKKVRPGPKAGVKAPSDVLLRKR